MLANIPHSIIRPQKPNHIRITRTKQSRKNAHPILSGTFCQKIVDAPTLENTVIYHHPLGDIIVPTITKKKRDEYGDIIHITLPRISFLQRA